MAWLQIPFPPCLAFGIQCDPSWEVSIASTRAGWESRNLDWAQARHEYDAAFVVRTRADHKMVRDHFHMARGQFHTWPLRDPLDHSCSSGEGVVVMTAGSDATLQLYKQYGDSGYEYLRKITRPVQGTIRVTHNGASVSEGSDWSLNYDTGALTFDGADAEDIAWTGDFDVPCRYGIKKLTARVVNRGNDDLLVESDSILILEVRE